MSWSIYKIQNIFFSVIFIFHLYGMTLYRYTSFFFQIHVVKHLSLHNLYRIGIFQKSVGKS